MSLSSKLASYKQELADATTRNTAHSRPAGASAVPQRTSTPKPATPAASADTPKRSHEEAFSAPAASGVTQGHGQELLTQVHYAIDKLKSNKLEAMTFESLISYLSLPNDANRRIPLIKQALQANDRVDFIPKRESSNGKDSFRYRPKHPVTNAEELKNYLARQTTATGILVKELKDGWPDCQKTIDDLERDHFLLATRNKKDNTAKMIWADSPAYHVQISSDFRDYWSKTKLPTTETEIRNDLEKAGITPTSQVKEIKRDMKKKDRKKPTRRGGKTTNHHMAGILKDYSRK
ncbi:Putative transcription factor TFIIE beta subunit, DNA-binding domain, TFA2, Winged helix domain 2 [Septoria linicola]|uniref:Transcription initiation factor IIE subunit beta n=1 Tax=Septoria linicola TaxID=215465 RepID=A0A9Q9AMY6_9PEZI|nr:putative transcription factor TFIIE beta subunit, DNA-binding domain, TFA2, Winged helix domain 2 [Septoria linicola]USW52432.1 Putative transcription factor TFIIE beta subunit, DNA-binding domain, TFA2, Winged helix domain 2 [Septoria linicola]